MKRTILFALLLSLVTVSASAQKPKAPERIGWGECELDDFFHFFTLYGNVESVECIRYSISLDSSGKEVRIKDNWEETRVYKFNNRGDVTKVTIHNSDSLAKKAFIYKYKYDSKGNVIEWTSYNPDGSLAEKTIYKYDSKGNEIEKATYASDSSLTDKTIYKYDSQGNMIEETYSHTSERYLGYKELNKYDSRGRLIESAFCNLIDYIHRFKYDSKGNVIETSTYNQYYQLAYKLTRKYDSKGNMIEEAMYNADGSLDFKWLHKYDTQGNMTSSTMYEGNSKVPKSTYEYKITYRE